jgi:hypothetical protein
MRWIALLLLLAGPAAAEKLYADARSAHIGPKALAALGNLRKAGVVEILVPTWLPADLHNLRVKSAEGEMGRFGPSLQMEWPSDNPHRSLTARGGSGGFGGPGPDSTVKIANPTLGSVEMWQSEKQAELSTLGTDWIVIPGAMPRQPKDRQYYMGFDTAGHFVDCLTRPEMRQILASLRYFRI